MKPEHDHVVARRQIEGKEVVVVAEGPTLIARKDAGAVDEDRDSVVHLLEQEVVPPAAGQTKDAGGVGDAIGGVGVERLCDVERPLTCGDLPAGISERGA